MKNNRNIRLTPHRHPHTGAAALALWTALALLAACQEKLLPPVDGGANAQADATTSVDIAEAVTTDAGPALVATGVKRFDPLTSPRSPEKKAEHLAKLKNGEDFQAAELLPDTQVVSQHVADQIDVSPDALKLPLKGNEALLGLKPGAALLGPAAKAGARRFTKGDNVFGFMRKVKSVTQVGDSIVIATDPAKLNEVLAGAVNLSTSITAAGADIDVTGIDLRDYFGDLHKDYKPGVNIKGQFEQKQGPWGIDRDRSMVNGLMLGGEYTFPATIKQTVDGVEVEVDGDLAVKAKMGFDAGIHYGFDIDTPLPDFWNSSVNYVNAWLYAYAGAEAGVILTMKNKSNPLQEKYEAVLDKLKINNPLDQLVPGDVTLYEYGPRPGPTIELGAIVIPTTYLIEFLLTCEVKVSSNMEAEVSAGIKAEGKYGFEWTHKDGFGSVQEMTFKKWQTFDVNGSVTTELTCQVGPKFHWLIAGVAGPYIYAQAGARATVTFDSTCPASADLVKSVPPPTSLAVLVELGVKAALGGSVYLKSKGKTLWEYDIGSIDIFEYWWEIWQKTWKLDAPKMCKSDCENGVMDNDEGDIDCGGVCKKCPAGAQCKSPFDCPMGMNCTYGVCSTLDAYDTCNNGKKEADEWDTDCSAFCGKCKVGQWCDGNDKCANGMCAKDIQKCASYDCGNGFWDVGGETDMDCGGECVAKGKACKQGKMCLQGKDCAGGFGCLPWTGMNGVQGLCVIAGCDTANNGKVDGLETGVDCGGGCAGMKVPAGFCKGAFCDAETFLCPNGEGCKADKDCLSANCITSAGVCGPDHCVDTYLDKGETDVDCGGTCKTQKCKVDQLCGDDGDCDWKGGVFCSNWNGKTFEGDKRCKNFWNNGLWDQQLEPWKDCGGKGSPNKCVAGNLCWNNDDCDSALLCQDTGFQYIKQCLKPGTCSDGQLSGFESDVDCGAFCGAQTCKEGQKCRVAKDCQSKACAGAQIGIFGEGIFGACLPVCGNGIQDSAAGESDVDCGGPGCVVKCAADKKCKSHADCATGMCSPKTWLCAVPTCDDGMASATESDIDCGGTCAFKCGLGQKCGASGDCFSKVCEGSTCKPTTCENGAKDNGEADIDCGGICAKHCKDGQACGVAGDCLSGQCLKSGLCGFDPCQDGKKGGTETDIDCGGVCAGKCAVGQGCAGGKDCGNGICDGTTCVASTCQDKQKSGGESDVDCGGSCPATCATGKACSAAGDCASGFCNGSVCVATGCVDKALTAGETDVDCGGVCAKKCAFGQKCGNTGDCAAGECTGGKCQPVSCANGIKDLGEADVDCGGVCAKACADGKGCGAGGDCNSGQCLKNGVCGFDPCQDGKKAGSETDVDCGGLCAAKCAVGKGCGVGLDCQKGICDGSVCVASTCADKQKTLGETDVDCGGPCSACATSKGCKIAGDCLSGFCDGSVCVVSGCVDKQLSAGETDIDCGGGCAQKCAVSQKCVGGSDCATGVCAGGKCQVPLCENGALDSGEADIDCGGNCGKACGDGKTCKVGGDCNSAQCLKNGVCGLDPCQDGKKAGTETDIDCGGLCSAKCAVGKGCAGGQDCGSGVCDGTACVASTCEDKQKTVGETDIDCGGTCSGCATSKGCKIASDCLSSYCDGSVCVVSGCVDKQQSPGETDVDCGGGCAQKCAVSQKCVSASDCATGVCGGGKCQLPACVNGKLDVGEADIDCGGSCGNACADGKTCKAGGDCASAQCLKNGVCGFDPCQDGKKGGAESDIDCGGGCVAKCAVGQGCASAKDCAAGFCDGSVCVASACQDKQKSPGEADIDCGGTCAATCATGLGCKVGGDCASGFCDGSACVATACQDKVLSAGETDVDCGGSCATTCALSKGCKIAGDCQSGVCNGTVCVSGSCFDNKRTDNETDVDCGGACAAKCSTGKGCNGGGDCSSAICSVGGLCVTSLCDDGKVSGSETDVDCGGSCATTCLVGKACKAGKDCFGGLCAANSLVCVATTCQDEVKTAGETDVDCGGSCSAKCATGKGCAVDGDCTGGICSVGGLCVASLCEDGKKSGDESDVDCGGSCGNHCATGLKCKTGGDCASSVCAANSLLCVSTTCSDEIKDSGESDVDCGGTCSAKCATGKGCGGDGDCGSGICSVGGLCVASLCQDGKVSGGETDVDCGGSCAATCGTGKGCKAGKDCGSGLCAANILVCVATTCEDQVKEAGETDIDCGGNCAAKCATGKACSADGDCGSGICSTGGVCVASLCQDGKKSGDESDIDCGGSCAADCATGKACKAGGDCVSSVCAYGSLVCVASTCSDEIKDGDESDIDCGGVCAQKCAAAKGCNGDGDCGTGICSVAGLCVTSLCDDGKVSGDESDVDCGGSCALKCLNSEVCKNGADCTSGLCAANSKVCVGSPCQDQVKDGGEMGADCGSVCGVGCAVDIACAVTADCASLACGSTGKCAASGCVDGFLTGDETGLDCGGSCADHCAFGGGCATDADCATGHCGGGVCGCAAGTFWSGSACAACACNAPGSMASTCDGAGVCACKAGWSGGKCGTKSDVCVADSLVCVDSNPCTADSCDPVLGCQFLTASKDGIACDDSNKCTADTTCLAGACQGGTSVPCPDDGNACTLEGCDKASGTCTTKANTCDDSNACTTDSCDTVLGCQHSNSADGAVCAGLGHCKTAACVCDDGAYMKNGACVSANCNAEGTVSPLANPTTATRVFQTGWTNFGLSVGASDGYMVAGNPQDMYYAYNGFSSLFAFSGAIYPCKLMGNGSWYCQRMFPAITASPYGGTGAGGFGGRVAISKHAAVGTRIEQGLNHSSVFYFLNSNENNVNQNGGYPAYPQFPTMLPSGKDTYSDMSSPVGYGSSLAMGGEWIVVGVSDVQPAGAAKGALMVYRESAAGYTLNSRIVLKGMSGDKYFGRNAAVAGNRIIAGAYYDASAWIWEFNGSDWQVAAKLTKGSPGGFGLDVAIDGGRAVVSDPQNNLYVFDRTPSGTWVQSTVLTSPDPTVANWFGSPLGVQGDTVLAGVFQSAGSANNQVFAFRPVNGVWTSTASWTNPDGEAGDNFGYNYGYGNAMAFGGGMVVVGAPNDSPPGFPNNGSAWVFKGGATSDAQGKCQCRTGWSGDKCDVAVDQCAALHLVCNDGNSCTADSCDATTGCVFTTVDGTACSDGNSCTASAACLGGSCIGTGAPKVCPDDGDPCTIEFCDPSTSACAKSQKVCDDGLACTSDACVANVGCTFTDTAYGGACGGGAGKCQGADCVCGAGTWLSGGLCADCGCDAVGSSATWDPATTLASVGGAPGANYELAGQGVATSGNYAAVGIPGRLRGVVDVLERQPSGAWKTVVEIANDSAYSSSYGNDLEFGRRLAMDGNRLAVTEAHATAMSPLGGVHLYERSQSGAWLRTAKLYASDVVNTNGAPDYHFGDSLALAGDALVVGEPYQGNGQTGTAFAFERVDGIWGTRTELPCIDNQAGNSQCGAAVAVSGAWAAIAAPYANVNGNGYSWAGGAITLALHTGQGAWLAKQRLDAPAGINNFGTSLAMDGNILVVFANPYILVYRLVNGVWTRSLDLPVQSDSSTFTNARLALHGTRLLVGTPSTLGTGVAWLYQLSADAGVAPVLTSKLSVPAATTNATLGDAVAIGDAGVVLGAPTDASPDATGNPSYQGGMAFFVAPRSTCDAAGQCGCKPGWSGSKCSVKSDVCLADSPNCDDGNGCTVDSCDAVKGCVHTNSTASCDDGNACTTGEACSGGACVAGAPTTCPDDGNACTVDACAPATGLCSTQATNCDDKNPCTTDSCNSATGCSSAAVADGTACGGGGTCSGGGCGCPMRTMLADGRCDPCPCADWSTVATAPPVIYKADPATPQMSPIYFGNSSRIRDGVAVVSTGTKDQPGGGQIRVIERGGDGTWQTTTTLQANPAFGPNQIWMSSYSNSNPQLDVSQGRIAALSSNSGDAQNPYSIHLFERNAAGQWPEVARFTETTASGEKHYGSAFALRGDNLVVGDWGEGTLLTGGRRGVAYTYARKNGVWQRNGNLYCAGMPMNSLCGYQVALSGAWAAVGAPNVTSASGTHDASITLYKQQPSGVWQLAQELRGSAIDQFSEFGQRGLAIDGDTLVVGGGLASGDGRIVLYRQNADGVWTYRSVLSNITYYGGSTQALGNGLSLSGRVGITGGPLVPIAQNDPYQQEHSWQFEVDGDTINIMMPIDKPDANTERGGIGSGFMFIGAPMYNYKAPNNAFYNFSGTAWIMPVTPMCQPLETGCVYGKACAKDSQGVITCK